MTESNFRAQLILCDWAEAVNGKLYMQGAGWNSIRADHPVDIAVALILSVPFDQTNAKHLGTLRLVTEDGAPYPTDQPFTMAFEFEIGRPPGLAPGASQNVPMVAKMHHMRFEPGRYVFESALDEQVLFTETVSAIAVL